MTPELTARDVAVGAAAGAPGEFEGVWGSDAARGEGDRGGVEGTEDGVVEVRGGEAETDGAGGC